MLVLMRLASTAAVVNANRVKAVVCHDIDGTLFSWAGRGRSAGNARPAQKCVDAGVTAVSIATGRIPGPWVQTVRDAIPNGALGPCVYGNGCIVVDANNNPLWGGAAGPPTACGACSSSRAAASPGRAARGCRCSRRRAGRASFATAGAPGGAPSEVAALIDRRASRRRCDSRRSTASRRATSSNL